MDSPVLLGFGQMQLLAERAARSSDGYPPYNIEEIDETRLRLTLAVAGFRPDDLSAQTQGAQLVVHGRRDDPQERVYLHRGIAARRFQRTFVLADGVEVERAWCERGLLHIDLRWRNEAEPIKPIAIETSMC